MIETLTIDHARYIAHHMRQNDHREVMATLWSDDPEDFANDAVHYPGASYAIIKNGEPVVMGGFAIHTPRVATMWMVGTDRFDEVRIEATRTAKKVIGELLNGHTHRLQALSAGFHDDSHEWLKRLGFNQIQPVPAMGKHGEDFLMFSQTRGKG